ncbi:MAG: 3-isopropylmalate dehydrogenase [Anaerolineaceae bacterium]|nr:3-isopropylmalate dehydrogenase [Anaerolineaceae bacterium]MCB9101373.1 3-isopropylmalate dehydrogenase [Anaerolineales bacterium]
MYAKITLLPGDGIGPEVVAEGVKILNAIGEKFSHEFEFTSALAGGIAIDETGNPLPDESLEACRQCDAVLLGAVGGPKWSDPKANVRPEQGLLKLRKELGLFANIRPVKIYPALVDASTLKKEVVEQVDMVIVRELTGGIYFGQPQGRRDNDQGRAAVDTMYYTEAEIGRLMRVSFDLARQRRKKITSVDKANVLASSRLWREVAHEVAAEYPDVEYEDILVDACSMYLIRRPGDFDVIATGNMFGDILSDEASMLAGSMGMLPSASLAEGKFGLYEPIHGSAPDIAGLGVANPLATILSAAMMLRITFGLTQEADVIEQAVETILAEGYRTADLAIPGQDTVSTTQMGDLVVNFIKTGN